MASTDQLLVSPHKQIVRRTRTIIIALRTNKVYSVSVQECSHTIRYRPCRLIGSCTRQRAWPHSCQVKRERKERARARERDSNCAWGRRSLHTRTHVHILQGHKRHLPHLTPSCCVAASLSTENHTFFATLLRAVRMCVCVHGVADCLSYSTHWWLAGCLAAYTHTHSQTHTRQNQAEL